MSFADDIAAIPQISRGKVWCTHCGREESVNGVKATLGSGWPTCCRGHTMTIDSPQERGLVRYLARHPDNEATP